MVSYSLSVDWIMLRNICAGTYDPIPKPSPLGEGRPFKDIKLDTARAKYWLGVGAQPSDPAWRLLSMVRFPRNTKCVEKG